MSDYSRGLGMLVEAIMDTSHYWQGWKLELDKKDKLYSVTVVVFTEPETIRCTHTISVFDLEVMNHGVAMHIASKISDKMMKSIIAQTKRVSKASESRALS